MAVWSHQVLTVCSDLSSMSGCFFDRRIPCSSLTLGSQSRFKVQDDEIGKDDLAAWACIRLDRLRTGFRFVRLLNATGDVSQGTLLVNIQKLLA